MSHDLIQNHTFQKNHESQFTKSLNRPDTAPESYFRFRATFINGNRFSILEAKTASEVKIEVGGEIGDPNLLCDQVSRYIC